MLTTEKQDLLLNALRLSLKHCQQENLGRPYDATSQQSFGHDNFAVLNPFLVEFQNWINNAVDEHRFQVYARDTYYSLAYYGVLFANLEQDYKRRVDKAGRSLLSHETAQLITTYTAMIDVVLSGMREWAAEYTKIELTPYSELTLTNFTVDGKFIN